MKIFKSIAVASAISAIPLNAQPKSDFEYEESIDTITFGSCYNPRENKHKIFDGILKHQPDVFIFVGDAIYGDTEDMGLLKRKWDALDAVEGFQKLRQSSKLLATWDDHDYGVNDGGKRYPMRAESSEIFLDFCGDSDDSPRRMRDGIYGSYVFGPDGKRCQILVLDTRYFRDDLTRSKGKKKKGTVGWYVPSKDESKTMLGDAQWTWLDQQFLVPADLRIIVSSTQILADEKGMENWGNLPHERDRLIALIKKHKAEHFDRHLRGCALQRDFQDRCRWLPVLRLHL